MRALTQKRRDEGFTLVELLVVVAILPLVAAAIAAGFVVTLQNKTTTQTRISDSHDAQITSEYFVRDVKSAQYISTGNTSLCGSTSYLLGLSWSVPNSAGTVVTDSAVYTANAGNGTLVRTYCSGNSTSSSTLSHDAFATSPAPTLSSCPNGGTIGSGGTACYVANGTANAAVTVSCTNGQVTCANSGAIAATPTSSSAVGVNKVTLAVLEHASGFNYTLTASPGGWSAAGAGQPGGGTATPPAVELIGNNPSASFGGSSSCSLTVNGVAAIDSSANGSITLGNNNSLSATEIYSQSSNPVSGGNSPPVVVGPPLGDPYSGMTPPSASDPTVHVDSTGTLHGALDGVYILNNGLSLSGNNSISSGPNGVLLYLAHGNLDLTGNGTVNLAKPLNAYQPIVIWVPASNSSATISLGGNGNVTTIGGTIYDPAGQITLNGGGNSGGVNAGALIANKLSCQGGGNGAGFTAGPLATTTTVNASPSPSADGQSVTLTATVSSSQTVNTGKVAFQIVDKNGNTTTDCAVPATVDSTGKATCTTGQLSSALSPYKVTAFYQGNSTFGPSTSSAISQKVLPTTTTVVTTTASNLKSGATPTFTAKVTASDGTTPTGQVTFAIQGNDGSSVNCSGGNAQTLSGGTATCTSGALLAAGSQYSVTASYPTGTTWFGSQSGALKVPVSPASTQTSVVSSSNPSHRTDIVTFTATVSPAPDGGSVNWSIVGAGASPSCSTTTPLNAGVATCTMNARTLSTANTPYAVTASYAGDASYTVSSASLNQSITSSGTSTSVVSSKPSSKPSDTVTFTATVGPTPDSGSVTWSFKDKNNSASASCSSTTPLTNGKATCVVNGFSNANAPYTVTANFGGSPDWAASSGSTVQQVAQIGTTTTMSQTFKKGTATNTATVTAADGSTPPGGVVFWECSTVKDGVCNPVSAGSTVTGTLPLDSNGQATYTWNNVPDNGKNPLSYCLAAVYQGTTDYLSSTSPVGTGQCFNS